MLDIDWQPSCAISASVATARPRRAWSDNCIAILSRRYVSSDPVELIALDLDRSKSAAYKKARALGLRRPAYCVPAKVQPPIQQDFLQAFPSDAKRDHRVDR